MHWITFSGYSKSLLSWDQFSAQLLGLWSEASNITQRVTTHSPLSKVFCKVHIWLIFKAPRATLTTASWRTSTGTRGRSRGCPRCPRWWRPSGWGAAPGRPLSSLWRAADRAGSTNRRHKEELYLTGGVTCNEKFMFNSKELSPKLSAYDKIITFISKNKQYYVSNIYHMICIFPLKNLWI